MGEIGNRRKAEDLARAVFASRLQAGEDAKDAGERSAMRAARGARMV